MKIYLLYFMVMSTLNLNIERPAFGGAFIARHEGKIVMVHGATAPGERVEATVDNEKRDYLTASVSKIIEPHPERIDPPCQYFGICGGCTFQHIPYPLQVQIKEEILRDCFKRLTKTEIELSTPLISEDPWNYRLRMQFKVSPEGIGQHKKGTNEIVNIDKCLIMHEDINEFIKNSRDILKGTRLKELHITSGDQLIAQVITRQKALLPPQNNTFASALLEHGISGVIIRRGELEPDRYGTPYVTLDLLGLQYTVSPPSFLQVNWKLNQKVAALIKDHLQPLKGQKILDLYAGAGNFSLPLADSADVTAVEGSGYAAEDGLRNVELNGINNVTFVRSSAEKFTSDEHFNVVILDPPRPGLSRKAMKNLLRIHPERIVYVSCNPATLARDLRNLSEWYRLDSIRMIDFFPQTFHIESLAYLSLK